jgi:hypothetical protein
LDEAMLHDVVTIGCDFGDAIKPNDHGIFFKLDIVYVMNTA